MKQDTRTPRAALVAIIVAIAAYAVHAESGLYPELPVAPKPGFWGFSQAATGSGPYGPILAPCWSTRSMPPPIGLLGPTDRRWPPNQAWTAFRPEAAMAIRPAPVSAVGPQRPWLTSMPRLLPVRPYVPRPSPYPPATTSAPYGPRSPVNPMIPTKLGTPSGFR